MIQDMVAKLQKLGGVHTLNDFAETRGKYVTPIQGTYKGRTLWQCPPNEQGVIALLLMNIMAEVDTFGNDPINSARLHWEIEAGRLPTLIVVCLSPTRIMPSYQHRH